MPFIVSGHRTAPPASRHGAHFHSSQTTTGLSRSDTGKDAAATHRNGSHQIATCLTITTTPLPHGRNVGLWRYYTPAQIPNFIIAAPMLMIALSMIWTFVAFDWRRSATLGAICTKAPAQQSAAPSPQGSPPPTSTRGEEGGGRKGVIDGEDVPFTQRNVVLPHVVLLALMTAYTLLFAHVQIAARLFSFQPAIYWQMAHLFTPPPRSKDPAVCPSRSPHLAVRRLLSPAALRGGLVAYCLGSALIGSAAFMAFYPPA